MKRGRPVALFAALFFLLNGLGGLLAQTDRGTISGTVTDSSAALIPNAKVTVTHKSTNVAHPTVTNETGAYVAPSLPPGDYSIRVEKEGFRTALVTEVTVNAGSSVRADIAMEIGATQQTVEISAEAIALSTDNAKSSTTITNKLVD